MYARVVTIQFQPGKLDEAKRVIVDSIVPVLKQQKGFKGQLLLAERATGKAISINTWETEADLDAFDGSPLYRKLMGKLAGFLAGAPAGERCEVTIQA